MDRKWMSTTAGIIDIICGASGIICGLIMVIVAFAGGALMEYLDAPMPQFVLTIVFLLVGIPFLILGVLALIGGIYSLQRKIWGMALAGAIASLYIIWFLGVASIVFTALGKREFVFSP